LAEILAFLFIKSDELFEWMYGQIGQKNVDLYKQKHLLPTSEMVHG